VHLVQFEGLEAAFDACERQFTSWVIKSGFEMRIAAGKSGTDHSVFCVSALPSGAPARSSSSSSVSSTRPTVATKVVQVSSQGQCLGLVELSLQPPNGSVPPALPIPLPLKQLLAWPNQLQPYISNLLVSPACRRQGVARALVAACEEQAAKWGYTEVWLHCDFDYEPAQKLYFSMGYSVVKYVYLQNTVIYVCDAFCTQTHVDASLCLCQSQPFRHVARRSTESALK
jgi:ribosomal protein S18 acetylase RimI-like enzyme